MHWFKRSPAREKSTSSGVFPAFDNARVTASFWSALSAFQTKPRRAYHPQNKVELVLERPLALGFADYGRIARYRGVRIENNSVFSESFSHKLTSIKLKAVADYSVNKSRKRAVGYNRTGERKQLCARAEYFALGAEFHGR